MTPLFVTVLALSAPALCISGLVFLNLLSWNRRHSSHAVEEKISILIPARNEEDNIERALRSTMKTKAFEIVVLDDHSSDRTGEIIEKMHTLDARVRRIEAPALPPGWVGKVHACHHLSKAAAGEFLLFIDADVALEKDALSSVSERLKSVDILTALPKQTTGSFWEHLVIPLLHLTYLSWLWLPLVHLVGDARVVAANGQFLAMTRKALDAIGGFEATKNEIVDDVAICRRAKSLGLKVEFADGFKLATCRMYRDKKGVIEGFTKNLYAGVGATPAALAAVFALYAWVYVFPFAALGAAFFSEQPLALPLASASVAAIILARMSIALRFKLSFLSVALHPLAIVTFFMIAWRSFRTYSAKKVTWRGRVYVP